MVPHENFAATGKLQFLNPIPQRHALWRYGLATLFVAIALVITLPFPDAVRPYYVFLGATVAATWYGGVGPGALSAVLSSLLGLLFVLLPEAPMSRLLLARYVGFAVSCFVVYGLAAALFRARAELRRSHLHFGGVVQLSEDAILTIDERQNITLFNPGAEKIFGYRAEEMLGKPVNLLLPERYRAMHDQHVRAFAAAPDALRPMNARGTIYGRRADGSEFPAEATISKFQAEGGRVMTVRLRDVSERYATEQRLRQMAAIVDSSSDAIISEDLNGVIISWNPGAEEMYGYTAAEAIGQNARMLLPPGVSDEVGANIDLARRGESATTETERMKKGGQKIEVALTVSPTRDRSGKVVGLATIVRDITDRKRLETQLLHSQKMEAVGRLAGGIAHDFNNLLSIIVGYTYLIQSSNAEGEPTRAAADQIMAASDKASLLTRQLLAFSRKQVMHPEVIDLNEVLQNIGKILPRLVGEDVDVRIHRSDDLRRVKADPGQVEQVIMNLVVNARDAMPKGGRLTLETQNAAFLGDEARQHGVKAGEYVMLAVSDNGCGMDAATRARIFEPFFTTKGEGKGTGLGLSTVYGIVNQSNGNIWVYSEPGQGTTFKIYFPATEAAASKSQIASPQFSLCGTETILLAEDEERLRDLLAHVLRDQGYQVIPAANGLEALRKAEEHGGEFDLLVTDVIMPEMRGQELAEKLQQRWPSISVLYMSGYTDNALMHSGALAQGTDLLQKPFTPDVVLRRIRQVLNERARLRAWRQAI